MAFVDLKSDKHWEVAHSGGAIRDIVFVGQTRFLTVSFNTSGNNPGSIDVWDLKNRAIERSVPAGMPQAVDISPTGRFAAVGRNGGQIQLYRVDSLEHIETLPATGPSAGDLVFLSDGGTLAVADFTTEIKLWNVRTGELVGALSGHKAQVRGLCTADNPPRLFSWSTDGEIRVWRGGP